MSKRFPFGPRSPVGVAVNIERKIQGALDYLDENAPARGFGMPVQGIVVRNTKANFGDLIYCDPTTATVDARGVYITVFLPKGERARIGEKVTVKNYSDSTNLVRVQPVNPPDTIDKDPHKNFAAAWAMATFLLIEEDKWISFRGDGCL